MCPEGFVFITLFSILNALLLFSLLLFSFQSVGSSFLLPDLYYVSHLEFPHVPHSCEMFLFVLSAVFWCVLLKSAALLMLFVILRRSAETYFCMQWKFTATYCQDFIFQRLSSVLLGYYSHQVVKHVYRDGYFVQQHIFVVFSWPNFNIFL